MVWPHAALIELFGGGRIELGQLWKNFFALSARRNIARCRLAGIKSAATTYRVNPIGARLIDSTDPAICADALIAATQSDGE